MQWFPELISSVRHSNSSIICLSFFKFGFSPSVSSFRSTAGYPHLADHKLHPHAINLGSKPCTLVVSHGGRCAPLSNSCRNESQNVMRSDGRVFANRKFGKHLQKRQLDIPEYAASFVNYKALKKVDILCRGFHTNTLTIE